MTVPAQELVKTCGVRLEREFRDRTVALRALPVSGEHLALEATSHAAIATFECHIGLMLLFKRRFETQGNYDIASVESA